ncbi:fibroblast growth factor 1-like [Copidosoma floridanum]|uniref:fibroblast growth factor 1-like n=1 Tax=Copidosoma floridanum TaxID=29053 RepID=UPI0006C942C4|nr:fibroblast growth factor 1-like [Copidosoma floridanum]
MSLRWIYENREPPVVDEECSDIDDSCSDDSYDSDLDATAFAANGKNYDHYSHSLAAKAKSSDSTDDDENARHKPETCPTELPGSGCDLQLATVNSYIARHPLKLKLFCRTGYYLGMTRSGRVKGFADESTSDAHVRFVLSSVADGVVRLESTETGHYLAINSTGHLYGELKANKDNTKWEQWSSGKYDSFRSHKYADDGWWLAIKNNGRHKSAPKTAWAQKATQFVIIRMA